VRVEFDTICIATNVEVICADELCGYIYHSIPPAIANLGEKTGKVQRTTDFAVNIQYIIGFLTSGDGGV
jgi:hypothetical protein